ncbi:hypothetical protein DXG03_001496 [Asterophora parasitica]|uniref:PIPK domain-containing protein n=1 Tax=Asterophora parasitica TaxID=117018 RepID=A0A9P7K989_9AGAR|nr:hypothetical protein DXG03_001496 [Asterophora parasitica]
MVDQKPLPALPVPAALAIDARQHRARLIRHFLSEVHETGIESRQEGWASVFEEVLDQLGQNLSQNKWLEGVRKWREQQWEVKKRERVLLRRDIVKAKARVEPGTPTVGSTVTSSKDLPPTPPSVSQKASAKHLLLCVAPPGRKIPSEDSGFDMVPANIGCTFLPGTYSLQLEAQTILFGRGGDIAQIVGGTFAFKGVTSPAQHEHLFRVLRLSIYVHLALTLEQHVLVDSNIALTYPRPRLPPPSSSTPHSASSIPKKHTGTSFLPPGFLSFFSSRKSSGMGHRSSTLMPLGRDVGIPTAPSTPPRSSLDLGSAFPFSVLGSVVRKPVALPLEEEMKPPFTQALEQIQSSAGLLSTSPGVRFDAPPLIVELATREKGQAQKLKGDERAALSSILGWEGRELLGTNMRGTAGFLRQQAIEVLVAHHVPGDEGGVSVLCGRKDWKTFPYYYAGEDNEPQSLGAVLEELVLDAPRACEVPGCKYLRDLHDTRFIHGGVKVSVVLEEREETNAQEWDSRGEKIITVCESCSTCGAQSVCRDMSDGTYLIPFGKFLELLIYSPHLAAPTPALCQHSERLSVRRHFGVMRTHVVTFASSRVEDIFELRVPRLQITHSERCTGRDSSSSTGQGSGVESVDDTEEEKEKRELRREIRRWWEGVADHMDKLEAVFHDKDDETDRNASISKALPRLPSADHVYDAEDADASLPIPSLPPTSPSTPPRPTNTLSGHSSLFETPSGAPAPPTPSPAQSHDQEEPQPSIRLSSLRQTFHRTEQTLYGQLSQTRGAELNDVRRSFMAAARGAEKRLCAWQKKHLDGREGSESLKWTGAEEPVWWKNGYHVLPASNIIVREDDWGSVIAFTLRWVDFYFIFRSMYTQANCTVYSTPDYQQELAHLGAIRQASTTHQSSILPQSPPMDSSPALSNQSNQSTHSSFFSAAMNYKLFTSSTDPTLPDPDLDDVTWSETEPFSAVVFRKEHPRDPTTSLLSIREVLRQGQKSPMPDPSRFGSLGRGPAPPSAWAKADVQVSKDEADGVVSTEASDAAGKILQEFELAGEIPGRLSAPTSRASDSVITLNAAAAFPPVETNVYRSKAPSIISVKSKAMMGKETLKGMEANDLKVGGSTFKMPPPPPPKDEPRTRDQERPRDVSTTTTTASFFANTLTSGLNNAMRFMLHSNAGDTVDPPRHASPSLKAHHGLLLPLDAAGIDERPHIKYDWTIGKRLKFSCTVYYAKQFDILRRRCGVDEVYLRSLQSSANWAAEGGKSRSNFWKTSDDRFVIKTLLDAWNVADLQVAFCNVWLELN